LEASPEQALSAWVEYLRDMGVYELYRREPGGVALPESVVERLRTGGAARAGSGVGRAELPAQRSQSTPSYATGPGTRGTGSPDAGARTPGVMGTQDAVGRPPAVAPKVPAAAAISEPERTYFSTDEGTQRLPPELAAPMPKPNPLESLFAAGNVVPAGERLATLERLREEIGDCTRCPLAYAGRRTIVFGEGDPNAALMFVGEGPGADEDTSGRPFVGKAGQLLNNMIGAMGLQREQVYIANIVKCRPPGNRTPEFVEATTCSQFLLKQIDIVRPKIIVALGSTAATYVLGVRQSLATLRGQWFGCRGAKVAVTYHPAFLLRDPRQKAEAWKDLQRVMGELGLKAPARGAQG
jgi:uracil-DNA glycosylase